MIGSWFGRYFLLVTYWIEDFALWLRRFVDPPYEWDPNDAQCAAHPSYKIRECPHEHWGARG